MNIILNFSKNGNDISLPAQIIRTKRKTVGISVKPGGEIIIRAPRLLPQAAILSFVYQKTDWILNAYDNQKDRLPQSADISKDTATLALEKRYREAAREYIPKRVEYYHTLTGGNYSKITIRDQKTRWGSCSSNGTLSFNYRLMLAPPRVLDYVVVHELCHLTHMNHSIEFWDMVGSILPEYKEYRKWLKDNGHTLQVHSF